MAKATASIGEDAFRAIVEDHRAQLHAHCYRMMGSLQDAEDAFQETLLRAWRGLADFNGRSAMSTWLYRIATNVCLDLIDKRKRRVLPADHGTAPLDRATHDFGEPLVESVWLEPYPDEIAGLEEGHAATEARYEQREAVELAFVASLQHLPATQRAVLVMRDVLGFSAKETAEALDTTPASVNSALQRARVAVDERVPERTQQETLRSLGDARTREIVESYMRAWAAHDVDALRSLLAEDAVFSMPPWAAWWQGRDAIAGLAATAADSCPSTRSLPTRANGQLALASYGLDPERGEFTASAIDVFTLEPDGRIKEITAFVTPEIFARFGLPRVLEHTG